MQLFVFDGLVGRLEHPALAKAAIAFRRYSAALDAWSIDHTVCDAISRFVLKHNIPAEVVTWQPPGFATVLHQRLYRLDVPVRAVFSEAYADLAPHVATDPQVMAVFDSDPEHRFSYGFKCRNFADEQGRF